MAKAPTKVSSKSSKPAAKKVTTKPTKKVVAKGPVAKVKAHKKSDEMEKQTKGSAAGKSESKKPFSPSKAVLKPVAKNANKASEKSAKPAALEPKTGKSPKKEGKKAKKKKKGFGLEGDDLLTSDEEIGSEEIPDLSEFEETEVEESTMSLEVEESEEVVAVEAKQRDDEVVLTDAEGRVYCRVRDCDQISAVEGYCRYHYLLLWKKIQVRRKILVDGKLERYVEELTSRYPDKFLEMIRKDLRTEKDFLAAIAELEIDESANESEFEDEAQSYVDEMRGITPEAGMSDEEEF